MWKKHPFGPVIGKPSEKWFDVCVLREEGQYWLYASLRSERTVMRLTSPDGIRFGEPKTMLKPPADPLFHFNRACVLRSPQGEWRMYVTYQYNPPEPENATSEIVLFRSKDGVSWSPTFERVLQPTVAWEKSAVMCPHVLYDADRGRYRMWYSGGEQYEPDAIGYAESADGVCWQKESRNPIFAADPSVPWECCKVTACQVLREGDGFRMFYTGFCNIDTAAIGTAVSPDGITGWERDPQNPIVAPHPDDWDTEACYKPFALREENGWKLWYNGRREWDEFICLAENK